MERELLNNSTDKSTEKLAVKELAMKLKPMSSVMKDWGRPGISG